MKDLIEDGLTKNRHSQNKIIISSLHLLFPSLEKQFYLSIVINGGKPLKGKTIEFKGNSNSCVIGQSFFIDTPINSLDSICFLVFNSKINETKIPLFKGEINGESQVRDNHSQNLICYLKTSNNEDFAVIYYNFEFQKDNIFQNFIKNQKRKVNKNSMSLLDYSVGNEINNYKLFMDNYNIINFIMLILDNLFKWKSFKNNIIILVLISIIIFWFKIVFVFLIPFGLIVYHYWIYKEKIDKKKRNQKEQLNNDNTKLLLETIHYINKMVKIYEEFIHKLMKCEKQFIEEIYINLIKVSCILFVFVYIPIWKIIPFRLLSVICLWFFFLSYNTYCSSIYVIISNYIFLKLPNSNYEIVKKFEYYLYEGIYIITPFLQMIYPKNNIIKPISDISPVVKSSKIKFNLISEVQKFEIYENERWWVVIGWVKKMLMNECALWCLVSDLKTYCDTAMIALPDEKEYKWGCEWKIEKHDKTDKDGWEYGDDFQSEFSEIAENKYVRRRKWVRYAAPILKEKFNDLKNN